MCPHNVRPDEVARVGNAPVDERLGRRMHHAVRLPHQREHDVGIRDIALHEAEPFVVLVLREVLQGSGVGELVQDRQPDVGTREQ